MKSSIYRIKCQKLSTSCLKYMMYTFDLFLYMIDGSTFIYFRTNINFPNEFWVPIGVIISNY